MATTKTSKIRLRFIIWFLTLSFIPLTTGLIFIYSWQKSLIEEKTLDKLVAIRDLKVEQLNQWLAERKGDIQIMAFDLSSKEELFIETEDGLKELNRELRNYTMNSEAYLRIKIIDTQNNKIIQTSDGQIYDIGFEELEIISNLSESGDFYIHDIYYNKKLSNHTLSFAIPLRLESSSRNIILVAHLDLQNSLYKLLLDRVGLGNTGETLIVNKEVVALNELRWYQQAPLNLQIQAEPAVNAANGKTGITKTTDYRGEPILAAYTYIPMMKWGFVCKQDLKELNAPIDRLLRSYIMLLGIIIVIIVVFALIVSNTFSSPIRKMDDMTKKMSGGDFSSRIDVDSKDELGSLAMEINRMAEMTESKLKLLRDSSLVSKSIISFTTLDDFSQGLTDLLLRVSGADAIVFYIKQKDKFIPFSTIGYQLERLNSFRGVAPEGVFAKSYSEKEIVELDEISDPVLNTYNLMYGAVVPRQMITIPLIVESDVVGFFGLVSINKFEGHVMELFQQAWSIINTSYANIINNERTNELSAELKETNHRLEIQTEELRKQSEELLQKSDALHYQNIELENKRTEIEKANNLKSEFLSNMSHELRTPLNSINALSYVLSSQLKEKIDDEELNYIEIIQRNGKRLLSLINDILDLSKIEAGKVELELAQVDLVSVVNNVKDSLHSLADQKELYLKVETTHKNLTINSDEMRLSQLLTNLVGNAVKFTKTGGVTIGLEESEDKSVNISVRDTGIGIPKEQIPVIFDEFRQVDGTTSRNYEGTGLGLAIVKKLVELLGGSIQVESVLGVGSVFTIKLNTGKVINPKKESEPLHSPVSNKSDGELILIVDDDVEFCSYLGKSLNEHGFNVEVANTGSEGLEKAKLLNPFAITLDVIMPDIDGFEVLQTLKSDLSTRNIPVVMISVHDDTGTALALGAVKHLTKPVSKEMLVKEIKSVYGPTGNLLVIDDDEGQLTFMKMILEENGYVVNPVSSGKKGLELIDSIKPDVIILDLFMPEMDGFMVLNAIRSNPEWNNIPVVIVTAKDLDEDEKQTLNHHSDGLILKDKKSLHEFGNDVIYYLKALASKKNRPKPEMKKSDDQPTVLIIEDNPDNLITIKAILGKDYKTLEAVDGLTGIDKIISELPDLVLLDMALPNLDGMDIVKKIRKNKQAMDIPIIAVTAQAMKGDKERFMEAGCNDYVSKPINPDSLLSAIQNLLNS